MSIVLPFLALLLSGAFAAYHRLRLATWAALAASLLVACWLLQANPTATLVAAALLVLVAALVFGAVVHSQLAYYYATPYYR